jgi:hypothetical protein
MNREVHVRFWEGLGVRFHRATQPAGKMSSTLFPAGSRKSICRRPVANGLFAARRRLPECVRSNEVFDFTARTSYVAAPWATT